MTKDTSRSMFSVHQSIWGLCIFNQGWPRTSKSVRAINLDDYLSDSGQGKQFFFANPGTMLTAVQATLDVETVFLQRRDRSGQAALVRSRFWNKGKMVRGRKKRGPRHTLTCPLALMLTEAVINPNNQRLARLGCFPLYLKHLLIPTTLCYMSGKLKHQFRDTPGTLTVRQKSLSGEGVQRQGRVLGLSQQRDQGLGNKAEKIENQDVVVLGLWERGTR